MDSLLAKVARLVIDLFKDPEQVSHIEETGKTLNATLTTLENLLIENIGTQTAMSIFDDLPSCNEAEEMTQKVAVRDKLRSEVLSNRLRLSLLYSQLQQSSH